MAGSFPHPRGTLRRAAWPRQLQRAAILLGASGFLFWSSFAVGRWIVSTSDSGPIYVDLLLAWGAIVVHVGAWPDLWSGLRGLLAQQREETSPVLAWRAFLMTLVLILAALMVLPLEYHVTASPQAWLLVLYVTSFPYLAWTLVPVLGLHGILFGRVASYMEPRARTIIDLGAFVLFAVAAASTAVILQNPGATAFVRSWSVGRGILPAAALGGYLLVAGGMTLRAPVGISRARSWPTASPSWRPVTPARGRGPRPSPARPRFRPRSARGHP